MKTMQAVRMMLLAMALAGCKGGGGSGTATAPIEAPSPGSPTAVSIVLKSGTSVSCFRFRSGVYCFDGLTFDLVVEDSNSDILTLQVWDDTYCWTTIVQSRPYNGDAGTATYCVGEANLNGAYAAYPIVFGGPSYSTAEYGSPDMNNAMEPFMGGDLTMSTFISANLIQDGSGSVVEETLVCELSGDETLLTCPDFAVNL